METKQSIERQKNAQINKEKNAEITVNADNLTDEKET